MKIGNYSVEKLMLGSDAVEKVYLGSNLIYDYSPTPIVSFIQVYPTSDVGEYSILSGLNTSKIYSFKVEDSSDITLLSYNGGWAFDNYDYAILSQTSTSITFYNGVNGSTYHSDFIGIVLEGDTAAALSDFTGFTDAYLCAHWQCFAEGTLITLADGSRKLVEAIDYNDDLLVWDFDRGEFESAKPLWMSTGKVPKYNHLIFKDGTYLDTVGDHRIFNKEQGKFSYVVNGDFKKSETTFTDNGKEVLFTGFEVINSPIRYYNIITAYHLNLFANGILTSCRLSNLYPIDDMKYQKDDRELIPESEYSFAPQEYYYGLRLAEQPLDNHGGKDYNPQYEDTKVYIQHLMDTDLKLNGKLKEV